MIVGNGVTLLYSNDPIGVQSNILLNLPENAIIAIVVRIFMGLVCLLSFPLTLLPAAKMIEKGIVNLFPSVLSATSSNEYSPIFERGRINSSSAVFEITNEIEESESIDPPVYLCYIVRLCLTIFTSVLAITIPCFALVISLLGSCTVSLLTYIIPPLLHFYLVSERSIIGNSATTFSLSYHPLFDIFLFLLGLIIAITATTLTAIEVFEQITTGNTC